jgi:hypothetical protein
MTFTTPHTTEAGNLLTELAEAREELANVAKLVTAVKRLVLAREEGAASLNRVEWQEHQAHRRVELLESRLEIATGHPGGDDAA